MNLLDESEKQNILNEFMRARKAVALLVQSPNRDWYELRIWRTCMNNIEKLIEPDA